MQYVFLENSDRDIRVREEEIRLNLKRARNRLSGAPRLDENGVCDGDYMLEFYSGCDWDRILPFYEIMMAFEGSFETYENREALLQDFLSETAVTLQNEMSKLP